MGEYNFGTSHDAVLSDTANDEFTAFTVQGTAGTVVYNCVGGNEYTVTVTQLGQYFFCGNATNIKTTSTATGIVVA